MVWQTDEITCTVLYPAENHCIMSPLLKGLLMIHPIKLDSLANTAHFRTFASFERSILSPLYMRAYNHALNNNFICTQLEKLNLDWISG